MQNNSRDEILKRIAASSPKLLASVDIQAIEYDEIYKPIQPDAISCFKSELEAINGQCILCENENDITLKLKDFLDSKGLSTVFCRDSVIANMLTKVKISHTNKIEDFETMQVGITACEFLVARTGTVLVSSASESGRQMNVFPPIHLVIAHTTQLLDYLTDALNALQKKYGKDLPSTISTITGPSRTADIEKTLVLGAHGPKEFVVFLSKI
jgi:L-lactate dehydrogenase complex protein LldG